MAILSLLVLSLLCAASAAAMRKALRRLARWVAERSGSFRALANVAILRPAALDRDCLVLASALQPLASAVLKRAYPSSRRF